MGKKFTLEQMVEPPSDGEWFCIWLNEEGSGATVAENIGERRLGEIMVAALNAWRGGCAGGM